MFVTDASIKEDDERVNVAFSYAAHDLLTKADKKTANSSDNAKKKVK